VTRQRRDSNKRLNEGLKKERTGGNFIGKSGDWTKGKQKVARSLGAVECKRWALRENAEV